MPSRIEPERPTTSRRGVYLLTHPRSASNLFQTMMAKQPNVESSGYYMFDASFAAMMSIDKGPLSQRSEEDLNKISAPYHDAFAKLQRDLDDAQAKGTRVFTKEHCLLLQGPDQLVASAFPEDAATVDRLVVGAEQFGAHTARTNPTCLPDDFLLDLQPIFQIRHPALMFPSMVRAQAKGMPGTTVSTKRVTAMLTLRMSRSLYDWYDGNMKATAPKVIDADDIMNSPATVRQLCTETGLDPDAVQYEWETREEKDPLKAVFLSTLGKSTSIVPGLTSSGLDLDKEKTKWKAEFGNEEGEHLARLVDAAMPDYRYLLERRVRVPA